MVHDSMEKTIRIPIIMNGNIRYFYGGNLPDIGDGAIGDLIIPDHKVKDNRFVEISQWEESIEILPVNSTIMVGVAATNIPKDRSMIAQKIKTAQVTRDLYVGVKLLEPLSLQVRGSKKSNLLGVKCCIPDLNDFNATSINNAYSKISEVFKPNRKSHTGNVFEKCFYKGKDDKWYSLDSLRENIEGQFEEKLFLNHKIYKLNKEKCDMHNVNESELLLIGYLFQYGVITGGKIKELYREKEKYIRTINQLLDKEFIFEFKE